MKKLSHTATIAVLLMVGTTLFAGPATAAGQSEAQLRYKQERAECLNGSSGQDRATCLREAGAALEESRRGNLVTGDLARNGIARCDALPAQDRQDCVMRIQGAGVSSGSVRDGGILRELARPAKAD
jgi:hypothetical protein